MKLNWTVQLQILLLYFLLTLLNLAVITNQNTLSSHYIRKLQDIFCKDTNDHRSLPMLSHGFATMGWSNPGGGGAFWGHPSKILKLLIVPSHHHHIFGIYVVSRRPLWQTYENALPSIKKSAPPTVQRSILPFHIFPAGYKCCHAIDGISLLPHRTDHKLRSWSFN